MWRSEDWSDPHWLFPPRVQINVAALVQIALFPHLKMFFLICAIHIDVLPFLALCIMRHYARCCCCGAFFFCASFSNNEVPQTLKRKMPPPCSLNHIGILVTLYIMTAMTRQRASVWICQMINTFHVCVCYLWRGIVYLRSLSRSDPQRCSNNVTSIPTGVL